MRTLLVVSLLVATMLAGCTGGEGLSNSVVKSGDLGAGFSYWAVPEEMKDAGVRGNPGSVDTADSGWPGLMAAYFSAFDYNGTEAEMAEYVIVSQAVKWNNATNAAMNIEALGGCSESSFVIIKGTTVMYVQAYTFGMDDDDKDFFNGKAHDAAHAVAGRTGGAEYCGAESH